MRPHIPVKLRAALLAALAAGSFTVSSPAWAEDDVLLPSITENHVYAHGTWSDRITDSQTLDDYERVDISSQTDTDSDGRAILLADQSDAVTISNSGRVVFMNNTVSDVNGGAIDNRGSLGFSGNADILFSGNVAANSFGGAIFNAGVLTFSGNETVAFQGNSSTYGGSAINNFAGYTLAFSDNGAITFSGNFCTYGGATLDNGEDSTMTFTSNGNIAFLGDSDYTTEDRAVSNDGTLRFVGNGGITYSGNSSANSGGAIANYENRLLRFETNGDILFSGNISDYSSGGAVYNEGTVAFSGNRDITFQNNIAVYGGAISNKADMRFEDNQGITFLCNASVYPGGAIENCEGGTLDFAGNGDILFIGNFSTDFFGGAIENEGALSFAGNGNITFSENNAADSFGGAIANRGVLSFDSNKDITFSGNACDSSGGAVYNDAELAFEGNKAITFSNNSGSFGGGIHNEGKLVFSGNGDITFSENSAQSSGGAINNEGSLVFSGNGNIIFSGNSTQDFFGGAIDNDGTMSISGNGDITFSENSAQCYGGAIYNEGALAFFGNGNITFRGNFETESQLLGGMSTYGESTILSATTGKSITFYDNLYTSYDTTLELNKSYVDAEGNTVAATGSIVFTGKTTKADLAAAFKRHDITEAPTAAQILASRTSQINGTATLHAGSLVVRDQAVLDAARLTIKKSTDTVGGTRVVLHNGTLISNATFENGTSLQISGANTASGLFTFASGAKLCFDLTGASVGTPLLSLSGTLVQQGALVLDIVNPGAVNYTLLTCSESFDARYWTSARVTVNGAAFDKLIWRGNSLILALAPSSPTDDIVLTGGTKVIGKGEVLTPGKIDISGASNSTISGAGSIAGKGRLNKSGTGSLTISTANPNWSGDINISGGTVIAGSDTALGTGKVYLKGGGLNMGSRAIGNAIYVSANASIKGGSKYTGTLTLTSGTLTGDAINLASGKSAILKAGTVKNVLSGAGKVVKDTTGTVYLYGANTYKGGTTVKAGSLSAKNVKAFGSGTVTMTGGTLYLNSYAVANNINVGGTSAIKGGAKYRGTLTLTKGTLTGQTISLYKGKTATLKTGSVKNVLAGSGKVAKTTTGKVYLCGANTYKGGTTVKAGILSAKNAKAFGTGTVTMTGGALYLNSYAVANAITVSGKSIIKGSTKYKGKLTLTKGTLSGDKIKIVSGKNAYLKTGTVKNALTGTGHVYKQGSGTVTLSGANNWTGNTYVQGGTLVLSGSTVLRGTTRTYANSKLDVRRAVTMGNLYLGGGTLALKAGNTLTVTGTLTLATATKLALSGVTASNSILIKYGKLSNTSKKSLNQFFGLTSAYTVTDKNGRLTIAKADAKKGTAELEPQDDFIQVIAAPETYTATPNTLGQATWGTARAARLFDHTVRDHAQAQSVALDKTRSVWFAGMSGFSHVDDAADTNIYGGAVGMQFNGSMGGNVGIAIGQTYGHVSPAGATRVKQQTQHAALYGTKMLYTSATDSVSLTGTASYGTTDSDHETLDWTQHSAVLGVRGTWEHKLDKATAVYGFAGLEYLATDSESGSGSIQALQGSIGAGISHTSGRLTLHADASFTPDMVRNAPTTTISTGRLGFEVCAGASYRISDQWSLNAGYTYHNEKRSDSHEAYIGARCTF